MNDAGQPRRNLVRPRWVWGGLLLAVAGVVGTGVGLAALTAWVWIAGAVALVLGGGAMWYGGVVHDVSSAGGLPVEVANVVEGNVHEGVPVEAPKRSDRLREHARATNETTRHLLDASHAAPAPALAPLAAWVLVLDAAALILGQALAVTQTTAGAGNSVRDTLLAVVLGLAGLRLLLATGPQRAAVAVAALVAVALVANALLAPRQTVAIAVLEYAVAVVALVAAVGAGLSPAARGRGR